MANLPRLDSKRLTRRDFLKGISIIAAGALAAGCSETILSPSAAVPTSVEPIASTQTPAGNSTSLQARVAIAKAESYDPALLQKKIQEMLDGLGGLKDIVRPGDKVAIKINLTGGMNFQPPVGASAIESYVTHPKVVQTLGGFLKDAGAGQLYIVEALYDMDSYNQWGFADAAKALNAELVDLNQPTPYSSFIKLPVGNGFFIYQDFTANQILQDVDVFVSVSKMKCHFQAGVTHTMKNLIGITPVGEYRLNSTDWWRSAIHGQSADPRRIPRVIVDLNRARPIQLGLIDGIKASQGGEVPRGSFSLIEPHVLLAGKNALSTDAVATAVMSFDPQAVYPNPPFLHGDNHLELAHSLGLGTNHLDEIKVVGESIDSVRLKFIPSTQESFHYMHQTIA